MKTLIKHIGKGVLIGLGILLCLYLILVAVIWWNKDALLSRMQEKVKDAFGNNLTIGESAFNFLDDFPHLSVKLSKIKLTDSLVKDHGAVLFRAESVLLRIHIPAAVRKQNPVRGVQVYNGAAHIITLRDGFTNAYLLNGDTTKGSSGAAPNLRRVRFQNFHFVSQDSILLKFHDVQVKRLDVKFRTGLAKQGGKLELDARVKRMSFNPAKGSYFKDTDLKVRSGFVWNRFTKRFSFDDLRLTVPGQSFNLNGFFHFSNTPRAHFALQVNTKNVFYDEVRALLPQKLQRSLAMANPQGPLTADATVEGWLKNDKPRVRVNFEANNITMPTAFMDFTQARFAGYFYNQVNPYLARHDSNSRIALHNFQARWRGLPVSSDSIAINNLKHPKLFAGLYSSFDMEQLNEVTGTSSIRWGKGDVKVNLQYDGPLKRDVQTPAYMNGNVIVRNGSLIYATRNVPFEQVQADLHFKSSDLYIDRLDAHVFRKPVKVKATAKQLMTLINTNPDSAVIACDVQMADLDLLPYTVLFSKPQKAKVSTGKQISNTASRLDDLLDKGRLHIRLQAGKLQYRDFLARNAKVNVMVYPERYEIAEAQLEHGDGKMQLSALLDMQKDGSFNTKVQSNLQKVNVSKLFLAFNDFGQTAISAVNIQGILDAKMDVALRLGESGKVAPGSVNGKIDFELKDGELINFEPLREIKNILFRNRDMEHVQFADLNNSLSIRNGDIIIPPMLIQSTLMYMYVEGIYSMRGNTDIQIKVPLRNIRKNLRELDPDNFGEVRKHGANIFLRGRPDENGNIRFKLDLFNRYKNSK